MIVRRGHVAARLGAGLILAAACAVGPLGVYAAATPPNANEEQGSGDCTVAQASASPSSVEVGESVQISGTCFELRQSAKITVIGPNGSKTFDQDSGGEGSFSISYPTEVAGEHSFIIDVNGEQDSGSFTVTEAAPSPEEPTDDTTTPPEDTSTPPIEEPTDDTATPPEDTSTPPAEEPPADSTDDPTDDSTGDPTAPPPSTDDPATDDPATDDPATDDPGTGEQAPPTSTGPAESTSPTAPRPSDDEGSEPGKDQSGTAPTTDAGQQTDGQPTAAGTTSTDGEPTAAEQTSSSPAATAPGTATNDFPAAAPEYTAEQRKTGATAALMTSLFAHGVSGGQVGISPAEADARIGAGTPGGERDASGSGRSNASDGGGELAGGPSGSDGGSDGASDSGGELAETGTEVSIAAAGAGIALLGGAGLLWRSRRRD